MGCWPNYKDQDFSNQQDVFCNSLKEADAGKKKKKLKKYEDKKIKKSLKIPSEKASSAITQIFKVKDPQVINNKEYLLANVSHKPASIQKEFLISNSKGETSDNDEEEKKLKLVKKTNTTSADLSDSPQLDKKDKSENIESLDKKEKVVIVELEHDPALTSIQEDLDNKENNKELVLEDEDSTAEIVQKEKEKKIKLERGKEKSSAESISQEKSIKEEAVHIESLDLRENRNKNANSNKEDKFPQIANDSDFSKETFQTTTSMKHSMENDNDNSETLKIGKIILKDSPEWRLSETQKAAKIIEASVKYTSSDNIDEMSENIFKNVQIQDILVQAGLVEVSSSFFPLEVLHEVIPEAIKILPAFDKICGTYLVKKILRNTAMSVKDVMKYITVKNFESRRINENADFIKSIHSSALCSTIPTELAQSDICDPFQKGIKIVKNIIAQETNAVALKEIFNYVETAKFEEFTSPHVQTAYLRLANRISSPTHVHDLLAEEFAEEKNPDEIVGFKIFSKISIMNPYLVSNIDSFIATNDLTGTKKGEDSAFPRLVSEIKNCVLRSEEVTSICISEMELNLTNCVDSFQEHKNKIMEVSYHLLRKYPSLDNIPVQAALLGSAIKLSSPSLVHNTVAAEMLKQKNILPYIGLVAVKSLYQHKTLNISDITSCIKECILEDTKKQFNLAQWENIASFLQSGHVPNEYFTIDDFEKKTKHLFALQKIVQSLNESVCVKTNESTESISSPASVLNNLEGQMIMATISEKLVSAPIIESILSLELTSSSSSGLPFFGFRALKTAIEKLPLDVSFEDIDSSISTQDFDDGFIENKIALLLNTAYSIRKLVSFLFLDL